MCTYKISHSPHQIVNYLVLFPPPPPSPLPPFCPSDANAALPVVPHMHRIETSADASISALTLTPSPLDTLLPQFVCGRVCAYLYGWMYECVAVCVYVSACVSIVCMCVCGTVWVCACFSGCVTALTGWLSLCICVQACKYQVSLRVSHRSILLL